MSDILVEKNVVMKSLDEIRPYEKNPRRNDRTVKLLCEIIPKVGFNVPIVIDKNGVIVKGHARYAAAKTLGMEKVPCVVSHADEEAIRADRIADNKISEFSEWVNEELAHEVDALSLDFDLSTMGLPKMSYDDIPSMEDFGFEEQEETPMTDEEKQALYQRFLEQQARENAVEVKIADKNEIESALYRQAHTPKAPRVYGRCVCKRCGNVMYVDRNVMYGKAGTIRK